MGVTRGDMVKMEKKASLNRFIALEVIKVCFILIWLILALVASRK